MKSKSKDLIAITICAAGMIAGLTFFLNNLNSSLDKENETPIATITFRYRSAQRKFLDRVVWDRLQNNSPVYNGDIIRTAAMSEAIVHFPDSSTVELSENTLVQVYEKKNKTTGIDFLRVKKSSKKEASIHVDVEKGNVIVVSKNENDFNNSISVSAENTTVKMAEDSVASFSVEQKNIDVKMLEGESSVVTEIEKNKNENLLKKGESLKIDDKGNSSASKFSVLSPLKESTVLSSDCEPVEVSFSWNNFLSSDDTVCIELASDKKFLNIEDTASVVGDKSGSLHLSEGTWFWHIFPEQNKSFGENGVINVIYSPEAELYAPTVANEIVKEKNIDENSSSIRLSWSKSEKALSYQLKLADNPKMENAKVYAETTMPSAVVEVKEAGVWYWQVISQYQDNQNAESKVAAFEIKEDSSLENRTDLSIVEQKVDAEITEEPAGSDAAELNKDISNKTDSNSNIKFEEEVEVKPVEVVATVGTENNSYIKIESSEKSLTEKTIEEDSQKVKLEIVAKKKGVVSKATNGRKLKESDFSDSSSWKTWNDSSSGGKTTSSVMSAEVEYGTDLFAGVQLNGTVKTSTVKQYGLSLYMTGLDIPFSMLDGKHIKFKVVGDGNEYSCRLSMSDTGDQYGCRFKTQKNSVIQIDVPYSVFKQQTGKSLRMLDASEITGFSFIAVNPKPGDYLLTVFDIEAY